MLPSRPAIGRRLDRLARLLRPLAALLPPPDDGLLVRLARADRPAAPTAPGRRPSAAAELAEARRALAAGELPEALHRFTALTRRRPDDAWAWHGRGDALQLLGEPEGALDAYARAASIQPGEALHRAGLAVPRPRARAPRGRWRAWERALALDPEVAWVRAGRSPPAPRGG